MTVEDNFSNSWFVKFIIEPKYRIYRHLFFLLYAAAFVFKPATPGEVNDLHIRLLHSCYFILMFYFNVYVLIPLTLFKGRYISYLFLLITIIMGSYILIAEISNYIDLDKTPNEDNYPILSALSLQNKFLSSFWEILAATNVVVLMIFASTSIKLFQRWAINSIRMNEIEKNALQTELRELKNQINPHFLFNMLNNINVLVKTNPSKASLILLKLSGFLRYQLYENNYPVVALTAETQFLKDFLELENIRRDNFNYKVTVYENSAIESILLPPNLFTTFVENAVKHSADSENDSSVAIHLKVTGQQLFFTCRNSKPHEAQQCKSGGLGLENIQRRLRLLYDTKFELKIENDDKRFTVTLIIPI